MRNSTVVSGLYRVSEWIMRFSIVNILWLVFNLPLILLIVVMKYGWQTTEITQLWFFIALLAPFVFFPSTTAVFSSVRDWIIKDEATQLVRHYWSYYLENYKSSVLMGLFLTLIWSVWASNFFFYRNENVVLFFAFCGFGVLLYVFSIHIFSLMSHYRIKTTLLIRYSLMITIGKPVLSFITFLVNIIVIYGSLIGPTFVLLFFTVSLVSFLSFSIFYRMYLDILKQSTVDESS